MTRYEQTVILRTVAIVLAVIVMLLWFTQPAHAGTGYLIDQYTQGTMKYCVYDVMGDRVVITIRSHKLCPLTIRA